MWKRDARISFSVAKMMKFMGGMEVAEINVAE